MSSENLISADNQQETNVEVIFIYVNFPSISRILRDYTPDTQRIALGEDIVRSAWRHVEVGRNDQPLFESSFSKGVTNGAKFLVG